MGKPDSPSNHTQKLSPMLFSWSHLSPTLSILLFESFCPMSLRSKISPFSESKKIQALNIKYDSLGLGLKLTLRRGNPFALPNDL